MRPTGVRGVVVGLSLATLAVSGCSATHAGTTAGPKSSADAPSSGTHHIDSAKVSVEDAAAREHRCRADIGHSRLLAPFWLDNEHFDPLRRPSTHTAPEALSAYRSSATSRGFPQQRLHAAYAGYSETWRKVRPIPVWIVIRYGVLSVPSMSSTPVRVDEVAIFNDTNLRPRAILEALPSRCR